MMLSLNHVEFYRLRRVLDGMGNSARGLTHAFFWGFFVVAMSMTAGAELSVSAPPSESKTAGPAGDTLRAGPGSERGYEASELVGWEVKARGGEKLGEVSDLIIDARSGKVTYVVVASVSAPGGAETLRAVPFKALVAEEEGAGGPQMRLLVDAAKWARGPVFKKKELEDAKWAPREREIFSHYGVTWELPKSVASESTHALSGKRLLLANDVIGRDLRRGGQVVGTAHNVIVQLEAGAAAALVDPDDEFAGTDRQFIVALDKLARGTGDSWTTTLTREDFAAARPARDDSWASEAAGYAGTLHVWPIHDAEAGPAGAQRVAPVAAIRQAIQSEAGLGNVIGISAAGDTVVLTGTVKTKAAKLRIQERAESVSGSWDVDNQIRVAQQGE